MHLLAGHWSYDHVVGLEPSDLRVKEVAMFLGLYLHSSPLPSLLRGITWFSRTLEERDIPITQPTRARNSTKGFELFQIGN